MKRKFPNTTSIDDDALAAESTKRNRYGVTQCSQPLPSSGGDRSEVSRAGMPQQGTPMLSSNISYNIPELRDVDCDELHAPELTFSPSIFSFTDGFDIANWLNGEPEMPLLSSLLPPDLSFEATNEVCTVSTGPNKPPFVTEDSSVTPAPLLKSSAVAELYSRSHSPAIDRDAVEPRHYIPTMIELDAPLILSAFDQATIDEIEQEALILVEKVPDEVVLKAQELLIYRSQSSHYPAFLDLDIPNASVLNTWVQLYFEHFHPVFPVLHQPSFSAYKTHWLLVFAVAAIGAHFSNVRQVKSRIGALHELIRRHSSRLVRCKTLPSALLMLSSANTRIRMVANFG